jgi:integrase
MSASSNGVPRSSLVVRVHNRGTPYYEIYWRSNVDGRRQMKRRLGPAWVERDASGDWVKRRGRAPVGYLEPRTAPGAADALVAEVEAELEAAAQAAAATNGTLTFRRMAHEWLADPNRVAKPSTVRDYEAVLREPGARHKRGQGVSEGRIMAAFGDADVQTITPREVADFLRDLDDAGFTARNVNKYRQVICTAFAWAKRAETYGLADNPVESVSKRREGPVGGFDYYEVHDAELLAETLAMGRYRRAATAHDVDDAETVVRSVEGAQDADLVRVLFYVGLRLGEARALRWSDVDLDARMVHVGRAISAGVEVSTPKGGRARWVPLARPALEALRRQSRREHFVDADDYVFVSRTGGTLDDSAFRRRYKAARDSAGLRPLPVKALRNAAGSIAARSATAVEVRDLLGHSKLSTTDRYVAARWSDEFMERMDQAFTPRRARDELPTDG